MQAQLRALQLQLIATAEPAADRPATPRKVPGTTVAAAAAAAAAAKEAAATSADLAEVARLCQIEADCCVGRDAVGRDAVGRGAVAGAAVGTTRQPDNPTAARHAARADEVQRILARYMLELQPPASAGGKAPGGSLMDQVLHERAALHGMR